VQDDFWEERWRRGQIGFHRAEAHPALARYWRRFDPPRGGRVLVPLCGKSLDLLWLRDAGCDVIGVESSAIAVEAFCLENGIPARRRTQGDFDVYEAPRLAIWRGDFLAVTAAEIGIAAAAYDRAALVAVAAGSRPDYARHTATLLAGGATLLLVTLEYGESELGAAPRPPHSVDGAEVHRLYAPAFDVEELGREDVLAEEPHMRARGLTRLDEVCYRLRRTGA
jgi:thiopurine S-methyltransferase